MKNEIAKIEELVKAGLFLEARQALKSLNTRKIPRSLIEKAANLCFRVNIPNLSLRILGSYLVGKKGLSTNLNESELTEYAIALSRIGAIKEAQLWLESLGSFQESKTILYKAYMHIMQWEYAESLPLLQNYVDRADITPYERLIAKTNIAAAYVFEGQYTEAEKILSLLRTETQRGQHSLLLSNAYELSAQVQRSLGNISTSQRYLELGLSLAKEGSSAHLLLEKEQALLTAIQEGVDPALKKLARVREKAEKQGSWETLRECDFYTAQLAKDQKLLEYVLAGTPHQSYRKRLLRLLEWDHRRSDRIHFSLPRQTRKPQFSLDLDTLLIGDSGNPIDKFGGLIHKTLFTVTSDFYRPFRIGTIFGEIYPGEHYNPLSSPDRVHQVVRRLRKAFQRHQVGAEILQQNGLYRLRTRPGFAFSKKIVGSQALSQDHAHLEALRARYGQQPFSLKEARNLLNVSHTKAFYLVKEEINKNIQKIGSGPATKYKFSA